MRYITTREAAGMLRVAQSTARGILGPSNNKSYRGKIAIALYSYDYVKRVQEKRARDRKRLETARTTKRNAHHYNTQDNEESRRARDDPYGVMFPVKYQARPCPRCGARLREGEYTCKDCKPAPSLMLDESAAYGSINL